MIFVEYFERPPLIPHEIFRVLADQAWWHGADTESADELVAQLGRTLRLGPSPANMAIWRCDGFARLDAWESYFSSDEARRNAHGIASHKALSFTGAGCYDEIYTGPAIAGGVQMIEYFSLNADRATLAGYFQQRAAAMQPAILNLVIHRRGLFGPDPGGLAIWTLDKFQDLDTIDLVYPPNEAVTISAVGAYRRFGSETL
jgi:hypothetical protein